MKQKTRFLCMLLAATMIAATAATASDKAALADLARIDDLKMLFSHDAGKVRLVLLLSPT